MICRTGIFATPALIHLVVGDDSSVSFSDVLLKLTYKVVLPLCGVQHRKRFKRMQESLLVYITHAAFCKTFRAGSDIDGPGILIITVSLHDAQ